MVNPGRMVRRQGVLLTTAATAAVLAWGSLASCPSFAAASTATLAQSTSSPHPKEHAGHDGQSATGAGYPAQSGSGGIHTKPAEDLGTKGAQAGSPTDSRSSIAWKGARGESNAAVDDSLSVLSFTGSNVYPAITWSPWEHLAEPHREAVLTATSTAGDPDADLFMWTLPQESGAVFEGRSVLPQFVVCVLSLIGCVASFFSM